MQRCKLPKTVENNNEQLLYPFVYGTTNVLLRVLLQIFTYFYCLSKVVHKRRIYLI